jgi:hypothetical protein
MGGAGSEYADSGGWTYKDSVVDLYSQGTPKLFVRFGMLARNSSATSKVESVLTRLRLDLRPNPSGTWHWGPTRVQTKGSTSDSDYVFSRLSPALKAEKITELRVSLEMRADTGNITIQPAYQVSDDNVTWEDNSGSGAGTFTRISSVSLSAEGYDYGSFSSVTLTKKYIRFGVVGKNQSGSLNECCHGLLRVDWR